MTVFSGSPSTLTRRVSLPYWSRKRTCSRAPSTDSDHVRTVCVASSRGMSRSRCRAYGTGMS